MMGTCKGDETVVRGLTVRGDWVPLEAAVGMTGKVGDGIRDR